MAAEGPPLLLPIEINKHQASLWTGKLSGFRGLNITSRSYVVVIGPPGALAFCLSVIKLGLIGRVSNGPVDRGCIRINGKVHQSTLKNSRTYLTQVDISKNLVNVKTCS